jgi:predicted XRE-type DNA-binding protein
MTATTTRDIPADVNTTVQTARALERSGRDQLQQAADLIRDTARKLADEEGWTQAHIAVALGVSKQRVSQLVNPPAKKPAGKA